MNNKDERYLNVTLKNEEPEKDKIVISFSGIFRTLKKYLPIWVVTAVVSALLIFSGIAVFKRDEHKNLTALISFTFNGVEKGQDPVGNEFDVNVVKNPAVIEAALTEMGLGLDELENIRRNITFEGIIPTDAIDKITAYKSIYDEGTSASLSAAQEMLQVEYFPTQFKVNFNYSETEFSDSEAAQFLNTMLDCYRDAFFEKYGYNQALGSAAASINYTDYDYAEALDLFSSTLSSLKSYVDTLAGEDTTRFRSTETGYTFADLSDSIAALRNMDLDIISSYITVNNVTKDKDELIHYYEYRIESLSREKIIAEERLASITESFNAYEKDQIIIFGNGTDDTNTEATITSDQYNQLIDQKIAAQTQVSTTTQQIAFYNERIKNLKAKPAANDANIERVEADLASLNEKINTLIEDINTTADEYYETVSFANAYNILVPASASALSSLKSSIKDSILPILVVEALLFVVYICFACVKSTIQENAKASVTAGGKNDDEDENEENSKSKTE
ncbi:MAG: lipopolysaccharide biosynthesis protein [Ruminococcus sp.]|nr:lipopolysaccharide biosynthesis protein [Ruminococcus sp.]